MPCLPILTRSLAALGAAVALLATPLAAQDYRHGLSTFGELKYPADFKHFDYVNPDAPKGGKIALVSSSGLNTFDSFNPFILKGDAAQGLDGLFDTLMVRAADEPDAVYGLVARDAAIAPDRMSVTFRLRPEARFSDGSPVTADDVVFSFETLKSKGHPTYGITMRDIAKAEAIDAHTVRFTFTGSQTRDLPLIAAGLPVLSKAYYTAHDFAQTSLVPPLGSGPYLISDSRSGSHVTYSRRKDYWAKDLPVARGLANFDEVRFEYFRDRTAALEALKSGAYDFREEFTSRDWATAYDIPAMREGRMKRLTIPDANPSGAQGFFINTRRAKFSDVRVRKALDYAFDFEFANKTLFYGLYKRTASFFENSDMKAAGPPTPDELKLLEPYRAKLPPEVFATPYTSPVTDASGFDRQILKQAAQLLDAAGYKLKGRRRVSPAGEPLEIEFLIFEPTFERILGPYVRNLTAIGVGATIRRVDAAQYQRRLKSFDFDIISARFVMRLTPGLELRNYWGSAYATTDGSLNYSGIHDPVIDALIEKIITARTRAELVTATHAVDRVLRASHYWVPHWYKAVHHIVYWDKFGFPKTPPKFASGAPDTWWYDAEKAGKLKSN